MRPPNLITAMGDTLAGLALGGVISGAVSNDLHLLLQPDIRWLLLASVTLYAGGVVLNDLADAQLDAEERPERPIPSGVVSKRMAFWLATVLFITALGAALLAGPHSFYVATGTLAWILIYDLIAKNHSVWGPVAMGLCRSGNLLLGSSLFLVALPHFWPFLLIPLLYIAAITWISRFEVQGGGDKTGPMAIGAVLLIVASLLLYGLQSLNAGREIALLLVLLTLFSGFTIPSFVRVLTRGEATDVQSAVKRGVLSLTILNSAIAASVGAISIALLTLLLLPLSIWISRLYRVT
ncbi:MAG: UbiA-like protein EboC [Bacteroidota bacterium]